MKRLIIISGLLIGLFSTPIPTLILLIFLAYKNPAEANELVQEIIGYWNEMIVLYDLDYLNAMLIAAAIIVFFLLIFLVRLLLKIKRFFKKGGAHVV